MEFGNILRGLKQNYIIFDQRLGSGAISEVFLGQIQHIKEKVAIKIVKKLQHVDKKQNLYYKSELEISKHIASLPYLQENVCKIYEVIEKQDEYYVIMEYCEGGTLLEYILKQSQQDIEKNILDIALEIVKGVSYLHSNKIIHRDLKPENIYLSKKKIYQVYDIKPQEIFIFKIGDFGLSKFIRSKNFSLVGTINYMAPEILEGNYDKEIDIWSIGCILYELKAQQQYFFSPDRDIREIVFKIKRFTSFHGEDKDIDNLIKSCLVKNISKRITLEKLKTTIQKMKDHLEYEIIDLENSAIKFQDLLASNIRQSIFKSSTLLQMNQEKQILNQNQMNLSCSQQTENYPDLEFSQSLTVSYCLEDNIKETEDKSDLENTDDFFAQKITDQVRQSNLRDSSQYEKEPDMMKEKRQYIKKEENKEKQRKINSREPAILQNIIEEKNYEGSIKIINELIEEVEIIYLLEYYVSKIDHIFQKSVRQSQFKQEQFNSKNNSSQLKQGIFIKENIKKEFIFEKIDKQFLEELKLNILFQTIKPDLNTQSKSTLDRTERVSSQVNDDKKTFSRQKVFDLNQIQLFNIQEILQNQNLKYNIFIQLVINQIVDTKNLQSFLIYLIYCTMIQEFNQSQPIQNFYRYEQKRDYSQKSYPHCCTIFLVMLIKIIEIIKFENIQNSKIKQSQEEKIKNEAFKLFQILIKEPEGFSSLLEFVKDYFYLGQDKEHENQYYFFDQKIYHIDPKQSIQIIKEEPLKTVYFFIDQEKQKGCILMSNTQEKLFYAHKNIQI